MHPAQRIERTASLVSHAGCGKPADGASARAVTRIRIISAVLLGTDLIAFVAAAFVAFAATLATQPSPYTRAVINLTSLGASWHGWGTLLVLVSLLVYFGGRGHYTTRVPSWTQLGDVVIATLVALACDTFLTVAIYQQPAQVEALLRWVLFAPALLLLRMVARGGLRAAGLWSLRTLIVADSDERELARDALTSDAALGYRVIGTVTPQAAAAMEDAQLLDMIAAQGADFVVVAVGGGGDPEAEHAVLRCVAANRTAAGAGSGPARAAGHRVPPALFSRP